MYEEVVNVSLVPERNISKYLLTLLDEGFVKYAPKIFQEFLERNIHSLRLIYRTIIK